ncbi:hypothetical protein C0991_005231 [Blastosporella zonata]|nr:hypothetical protein C0991_005231 [Blastosporella zonata]
MAATMAATAAATADDPLSVSSHKDKAKAPAGGNDNIGDDGDTTAAAELRLPKNLEEMCTASDDNGDGGTMLADLPLRIDVDEIYTLPEDEKDLGWTVAGLQVPTNVDKIYTLSEDDKDIGTPTAGLQLPANVDKIYTFSENEGDSGTTPADLGLPPNVDQMFIFSDDEEGGTSLGHSRHGTLAYASSEDEEWDLGESEERAAELYRAAHSVALACPFRMYARHGAPTRIDEMYASSSEEEGDDDEEDDDEQMDEEPLHTTEVSVAVAAVESITLRNDPEYDAGFFDFVSMPNLVDFLNGADVDSFPM